MAAWWLGGAVGQSSLVGGNVNGDGDGKRVKVMGKGHFLNTDLSYCSKTHIYSSKHTFTLQNTHLLFINNHRLWLPASLGRASR